jgi:DtxR family transcriptional regulator, Mn-dependent transcriptional regulator
MDGSAVTRPPSTSVGDYVKALWEVGGAGVASTKDIADRLSISSASVTNMFARLQEMGLVEYERYHGASLTEEGCAEALRLVRRHRLIETFLVEHLNYPWEEVHEEAERLEHAVSDVFTERLSELLGHPNRDPHGTLIPAADGSLPPDHSRPLAEAEAEEPVVVARVENREPAVLSYLRERGLVPGRLLTVREARAIDGVVTVETEEGNSFSLGDPLASSIFVLSRAKIES